MDMDDTPDRQLYIAAGRGNVAGMKYALSKGADINWKNPDFGGWTPLIIAAYHVHKECVEVLLQKGANPNLTDDGGWTALDFATSRQRKEIIDILKVHSESRLLKAMKEGCVHVKYSKFSLSGPPGSGKSSLTDLLNNEKPLLTHNSTPVLTEPSIRQVRLRQKGGGEGRNKWNKVGLEDLKVMAAKALSLIEPDADTQQANTQQYTTQSSHATTPSHSSSPSPNGSSESSSASAVGKKALGYQSVSNLLIFRFIPALAEVHWIYGVDSGGQAAFLDIAPALLHHNSLNILVHKLNESLDDQPQFFFSVDGDTVGKPIKRQMTHLQFLHSSIRSLASIPSCSIPTGFASTNAHASGSVFLVLGTFLDKIGRQSLVEKNKVLWSEFEEYIKKGVVKAYKEGEESIIYPVVTTDRGDEAQAIAEEIRSAIREHYIEASVPIRWFLFQHELKKAHDSTSIIAKSEAVKIGASLGMDSEDVEAALQYYHDLTIILYFPSVLPHVVFLHPQPLFNKLSDLISVSFTDTAVGLKKMKTNRSIPDGSHVILKQEGKFNRKLLECLPEGFTEDFTVAHFLSLMESLLIIAPVDEGQYFIPCVLETCSIDEVKKLREGYSQDCDPFVVSWDGKIVPQGMYPALVVNLLKRGFTLVKKQIPYRNAIKLHSIDLGVKILLVDTIKWLEIHCAGPVEEACPVLNGFIHDAIKSVSSKFCYNSDTEDGTLCSVCPAGVCRPNKARTHITCTNDDCFPRKIGERQSCWFNVLSSSVSGSISVPFSNVLPEGAALDERHAPIVLKAIKKIVKEWQRLGLFLGIKDEDLKAIEYNRRYQIEDCRQDMVCHWIKLGSATREGLISALKDVERNDVAAEVKKLPTKP